VTSSGFMFRDASRFMGIVRKRVEWISINTVV
jgi:hypothetical protein